MFVQTNKYFGEYSWLIINYKNETSSNVRRKSIQQTHGITWRKWSGHKYLRDHIKEM